VRPCPSRFINQKFSEPVSDTEARLLYIVNFTTFYNAPA